ncbi:UNVERIFIED_CONTAM: hypothetical protein Slati_4272400 [Sesamum latifolium]|uniref:Reverse transcriptase domain-containing protein n=1 Tax=Sesamum latifolium TaxID=2727402 RepID=A0AAW2TCD5_9LAMI
MAPLKSPGPDGMPPIFFQKSWAIVRADVIACVLNLLNSHVMPQNLNATQIVLIPKCKHPEFLSQFRPISLCNVVYKIASKTITNRMKPILDRIISPSQSAFVPGRLISDNILLAFELNHFLNGKTRGEQGWMALKLDVSKAYDKVEWSFLEQVMSKSGFPPPFIRSLLQNAEIERRLRGIAVCRGAPSIFHLLFADDTLIFCQASLESSQTIREVLEIYRGASGQEINFAKSSVAFSKNTKENVCQAIISDLTIRRENKMELYLGLPLRVSHSKRDLFATIRDCIWRKLTGWNESLLSQAGKEVLIKAVIQAVPTYAMGCFKLPVTLLGEIQGMIARLWWGNRAPLAYHALSGATSEQSAKGAIFFIGRCFHRYLGRRPSFTWRSIMAAHDLFRAGCRWRVGTGETIRVWRDPWLPRPRSFRPITPTPASLEEMNFEAPITLLALLKISLVPAPAFKMNTRGGENCGKPSSRIKSKSLYRGLASMLSDGGARTGVGVCAHGASGECLAWLAKRVDRMGNDELAEALAAREAVLLALRKRWRSVIVEGDCATLIHKILSSDDDYSVVGPITSDIRSLSSRFHACVFQFVKHSCNTVAHALAKSACGSLEGEAIVPPTVFPLVLADCA